MLPLSNIETLGLFNALWNIVNCSLSSFVLYQVWKAMVVQKNKPNDLGGYFLALSVGFWFVAGVLDILHLLAFKTAGSLAWMTFYHLLKCWLSTWNSVFILCAIYYFDVLPEQLVGIVKHPNWKKWMYAVGGIVSGLSACIALYIWRKAGLETEAGKSLADDFYKPIYTFDFVFSTFTSLSFLLIIAHNLRREAFRLVAVIGWVLFGIVFLAQLIYWQPDWFKSWGDDWYTFLNIFFLSTYKVQLLILFSLIMLGWALRTEPQELVSAKPAEVKSAPEPRLSKTEICERFNLNPNDIELLRRLAQRESRATIAEKVYRKNSRSPVDERLSQLGLMFKTGSDEVSILLYSVKNGIISLEDI
jgi:hypothetical protein